MPHKYKIEQVLYIQGLLSVKPDGFLGPITKAKMREKLGSVLKDERDITTSFVQHSFNLLFRNDAPLAVDGIYGAKTEAGLAKLMVRNSSRIKTIGEESRSQTRANGTLLTEESLIESLAKALPLWRPTEHDRIIDHFSTAFSLLGLDGLAKVHLETKEDLAVFLGQVREETGPKFSTSENLNYSCSALPKLFSAFRRDRVLAREAGRCDGHSANWKLIADVAYGNRVGNGNAYSGDGFLFMGAGAKQLTFRGNYQGYHDWLKETLPEVYEASGGQDIMTLGHKVVSDAPHAVLSAIYFWFSNNVYLASRHMPDIDKASDEATMVINLHTSSYPQRRNHTRKIYSLMMS